MKFVKDIYGNSVPISNEEVKILNKLEESKDLTDREGHLLNRMISRGVLDDESRVMMHYKRGEE